MSAVVRKLKSNSGATLMLALLFFIVCAVTGSMILLSGTAASGRLTRMKTSDQNYYAVRSAAKFIEKKLQHEYIKAEEKLSKHEETEEIDDPVTGEKREKTVTTYTYTTPVFYKVNVDESGHESVSDEISGISSEDSGLILYMLMNGDVSYYDEKNSNDGSESDTYPSEFNLKWFRENDDGAIGHTDEYSTEIKASEGSTEVKELAVKMTAEMDSTGMLTLTFINSDEAGTEKDNKYSMVLKMQCNKSRDYSEGTNAEGDSEKIRTYKFTFETLSMEKG